MAAGLFPRYIEVKFLPSYSPDLNLDEYPNCDLKTQLATRSERRAKGRWRPTVENVAETLANARERIIKYFEADNLK